MRALLPLLVGMLVCPASASAATLGQVPPLDLSGDEYCLRTTGTPGELAVETKTGMRLVQATKDGLVKGREIRVGDDFSCQAVAGRANGAAVIAGRIASSVSVVVREPGGDWGAHG